ncbi:LysM peptidoglycan-binding domain-containing protein [Clostridium sp. CM028]|uniref:CAP domain-containing protein n=1 Tax=Clostridium sp. CM028 TaxID=2851575 RepID=UPI001C6DE28F|nr:CAP domain-containing protein [Clostridium sp. CM028]MBW9149652.1 LysM peptidoglycan-binding domain-containing protein [Clostridium sp. CM028]WLC60535.1 LysM peptidoglycan-binding domain-containing protein [Clostridium sp. CM028]
MKKTLRLCILTLGILVTTGISSVAYAAGDTINYTVKSGDYLWKICVNYEVGVSEVLAVNPQITKPDQINVNQIIKIPNLVGDKKLEKDVVILVNQERAKQGLAPLKDNWELSRVARYKSQDMADKNYFSHTSPTYGSPFDMMKNFGITYKSGGENIAMGQQTAASVMSSWMNSPGHKANILSKNFTEIGVGTARDKNGTIYWTQQFIGK